ncbi:hypothetical protein [Hymenobacter fodinae]|uniref:Uncharacterized protein n=1 Tax=Hymenobacter fodinae TaxID=2510796 RepID=A0A4Z0P3Z5_9BACT|nr:hypothetical protein [Hymenobacter fodinae]TGE06011.1 hypothetical protein EU556_14165 [Hymenobacter fodinae]
MDDRLILLQKYYLREQRTLSKQLREAMQEQDYRLAARIQKGQYLVAEQLRSLRTLQNKHADELDQLERSIRYLKNKRTTTPTQTEYHSETLMHYEQRWQKLQAASAAPAPETSVLGETMNMVLTGQIAGFRLILSTSVRLGLSVRRVRRTAIVTLPELVRHREAMTIRKGHLRQLCNMGFGYYDQQDKLMAFEPLATAEDVERIMQLLMRITSVVFSFRELGGEAEIRYFLS